MRAVGVGEHLSSDRIEPRPGLGPAGDGGGEEDERGGAEEHPGAPLRAGFGRRASGRRDHVGQRV